MVRDLLSCEAHRLPASAGPTKRKSRAVAGCVFLFFTQMRMRVVSGAAGLVKRF